MDTEIITVAVEVAEQDIAAGVPRDCERCPIALAVARAWPGPRGAGLGVEVDAFSVTVWADTGSAKSPACYVAELPQEAVEFIPEFDHQPSAVVAPVKPFTFTAEFSLAS